jgi:putative peptidoglycan lipid II flippase
VAASELPELSRARSASPDVLAARVRQALTRVLFLLIPSALAYLVIGDTLIGALFERGAFGRVDTALVYAVLAAYAIGLVASSSSRVLSSAYYALRDTKTPARVAYLRIALSVAVGIALMIPFDRVQVGTAEEVRSLGAAGLAMGASAGAWLEYVLLRRGLTRALGAHAPASSTVWGLLIAGAAASAAGVAVKLFLGSTFPARSGLVDDVLGTGSWAGPLVIAAGTAISFGVIYLLVASVFGGGDSIRRLLRR